MKIPTAVSIAFWSLRLTNAFTAMPLPQLAPRSVAFVLRVAALDTPDSSNNNDVIDQVTQAFLAQEMDADAFLAAIDEQFAVVDNRLAKTKQQQPSSSPADQVVSLAKEGATLLMNGLSSIAQEALELAEKTKESLPKAKVGHSDTTYDQALDKVAKGALGMWNLCSSFGSYVLVALDGNRNNHQPSLSDLSLEEEEAPEEDINLPFFVSRKMAS